MLRGLEIRERITGHTDNIRELTPAQRTELVGETQQIPTVCGAGHQGLRRGQAVHRHERELARVQAVGLDRRVGPQCDRPTNLDGVLKHGVRLRAGGAGLGGDRCRELIETLTRPRPGKQRGNEPTPPSSSSA